MEGNNMYTEIPEPSLDPPEAETAIAACGCEVAPGDKAYKSLGGGRYICAECWRDELDCTNTDEIIARLNVPYEYVQ
jgi:hypothetical protein